jgi:hypothetical protein
MSHKTLGTLYMVCLKLPQHLFAEYVLTTTVSPGWAVTLAYI